MTEPKVVHGSRLKVGFVSIAFALISLHYWSSLDWNAQNGRLPLLGVVAYGVLAALLAIGTFLRLPRLVLAPGGLTFETGLAARHYAWSDIDQFRVIDKLSFEYWYSSSFPGSQPRATVINAFEASSLELVSLLSRWHAKYSTKAANQPLHPDALTRAGERRR